MTYRVSVSPSANADLRDAATYMRVQAPEAARAWLKGFRSRIKSLSRHPLRAPLAPEAHFFEDPIREVFYGAGNRGTYSSSSIRQSLSYMSGTHVRHGSMKPLGS